MAVGKEVDRGRKPGTPSGIGGKKKKKKSK